jgi:hypothetical protein
VKRHLTNIYDKLGCSTRLELSLFAMHHHLLSDVVGLAAMPAAVAADPKASFHHVASETRRTHGN